MNANDKATWAGRMQGDPIWQAFMQELHGDAIKAFVNSAPADAAAREQAHQRIRALEAVTGKLSAWEATPRFNEKKGQHRASD